MISVAHHHPLRAVYEGCSPSRIGSECASQSMLLKVGLVHEVYSVFITQFIPPLRIWIMTGSDGIDIALLQQFDVFYHSFLRHDMSCFGVHLVAVHAAQPYLLAVDEHHAVFYFHTSETYLGFSPLYGIAGRVDKGELQCVEIRMFGIPFIGILYGGLQPSVWGIASLRIALVENLSFFVEIEHRLSRLPQGSIGDSLSRSIIKHCRDAIACATLRIEHSKLRVNNEFGILVVFVEQSAHPEVSNAYLRCGIKFYATVYSGNAPHVLILKIAAVGVFHHLQGYQVLATL